MTPRAQLRAGVAAAVVVVGGACVEAWPVEDPGYTVAVEGSPAPVAPVTATVEQVEGAAAPSGDVTARRLDVIETVSAPTSSWVLPAPATTWVPTEPCELAQWLLVVHAPAGGWDAERMMAYVRRESGCDASVRSATSDTGLLQINDVNHPYLRAALGEWVDRWTLTDPVQNVRAAAALCDYWRDRGSSCYQPWRLS